MGAFLPEKHQDEEGINGCVDQCKLILELLAEEKLCEQRAVKGIPQGSVKSLFLIFWIVS